jgi:hypothetical protein
MKKKLKFSSWPHAIWSRYNFRAWYAVWLVTLLVLPIFMMVAADINVSARKAPKGGGDTARAQMTQEKVGEKIGKEAISSDTGFTNAWGGGDYVFISFRRDAAFGVIYGTETNPNSIIILAMHWRYLGFAEIYDEHGASMGKHASIKVLTVFGQKLEDIFEYNDTNDDGVCNYIRCGPGLYYHDYPIYERIYKKVSLNTSWTRSPITTTEYPDEVKKCWEFSLTAEGLNYTAIGDSATIDYAIEHEALDKVEFTFHLTAELIEVHNVTVPKYEVVLQKAGNRWSVINSSRLEDIIISGQRANYTIKYDHLIEGWDYDPTNANPRLLVEFHGFIGVALTRLVGEWLVQDLLVGREQKCKLDIDTETGAESMTDADASKDNVGPGWQSRAKLRKLKGSRMHLGDQWSRVAALTWQSTVLVDGEESYMYAQIQGHWRITRTWLDHWGRLYVIVGIAFLGGYSYPGGTSIYHDPGMEADMIVNVNTIFTAVPAEAELEDGKPARIRLGILIIGVLIAVIIIVIITIYMSKRRRLGTEAEPAEPPAEFDRSGSNIDPGIEEDTAARNHVDWERYYPPSSSGKDERR